MKGAAIAQPELLELIAAVQGCCFELAQLAATTPQATARSRTAMHPDGFLGVVNDVAAAGVDLAEVVFRPGDGLVGLGQGSDHLAQEDSTLCASSWRSSQYGITPRLVLHLAISTEQGFYSSNTSIMVAALEKLNAVSLHEVDAAMLLGNPARPDP